MFPLIITVKIFFFFNFQNCHTYNKKWEISCKMTYLISQSARYKLFLETKMKLFSHLLFLQSIGEFILTEPNIRIKPRGKIYSINEGYEQFWDAATSEYVQSKKRPKVGGNIHVPKSSCGLYSYIFYM